MNFTEQEIKNQKEAIKAVDNFLKKYSIEEIERSIYTGELFNFFHVAHNYDKDQSIELVKDCHDYILCMKLDIL